MVRKTTTKRDRSIRDTRAQDPKKEQQSFDQETSGNVRYETRPGVFVSGQVIPDGVSYNMSLISRPIKKDICGHLCSSDFN